MPAESTPTTIASHPLFGWPFTEEKFWEWISTARGPQFALRHVGLHWQVWPKVAHAYIDYLIAEDRAGIPDAMRVHRQTAQIAVLTQALASFSREGYTERCKAWLKKADDAALAVRPEHLTRASV